MDIKKPVTQRKHEKIYKKVEEMISKKEVKSVWGACVIIGRRLGMTAPSVAVTYYKHRKLQKNKEKEGEK